MKIAALIIKNTVIAFNSVIMNTFYRKKIGTRKIEEYKKDLDRAVAGLSTKEEAAAFVKGLLKYKNDPLAGFFDWTCDPVVLFARVSEGLVSDSCDCDDFASLLCYVLSGMGIYSRVRCRSVLSRKPFLTQGHSFVTGLPADGGIDVYSPYRYLRKVDREDEVAPLLESHFGDVKFYPFLI